MLSGWATKVAFPEAHIPWENVHCPSSLLNDHSQEVASMSLLGVGQKEERGCEGGTFGEGGELQLGSGGVEAGGSD